VRTAIRKHAWDFAAIVGLFVVALVVGGVILAHQRLYLPKWVPLVGSNFVDRQLELSSAQSFTPGQGQEIDIAGVKVGEVSKVELKNGRGIVTVKIRKQYADRIRRDASVLVRPKTGLNDQTLQLDPGTKAAGKAPASFVIPVSQTLPNINTDEVLAALDGDTRDYLRLLLAGAGQGLKGNSENLANTLRRFSPTNRDIRQATRLLAQRRVNIRRSIHNFRLLAEAVGSKDQQLAQLVDASNAVFRAFANQDARLRQSLQLLPGTLDVTRTNLTKADRLAKALGPTSRKLDPFAKALGPALRQTRPFLKQTTPIIKNELRPFARAALPVVSVLRPAARDLASVTPDLTSSAKVINEILNELAYNPPGKQEGYLFWLGWANHDGASIFGAQDAHGPERHGLILFSCATLSTLATVAEANPSLGNVLNVLDPFTGAACPSQAGPGSTPPGTTG